MTLSETIIVLHGLFRTSASMWPLAHGLRRAGFRVENWTYNSLTGSLPERTQSIISRIRALGPDVRLSGVGHSLGGLLLRGAFVELEKEYPLGRLVQLGTPNFGASIVQHHNWLFGRGFMPQTIRDMAPESAALSVLRIPAMEIGVIAGVQQFHPLNPASWLNSAALKGIPHDGTVELANVRLPQMHDFLEVPINHSFLPMRRRVITATVNFLQKGQFQ